MRRAERIEKIAKLEAELEILKRQQGLEDLARGVAIAALLQESPHIINLLAPEHDRTSCTDDSRTNGFASMDGGVVRCNRCALLDGAHNNWYPDFVIKGYVVRKDGQ